MALYGGKPEAGDIQAAATQLERDWSSVRADMRQVDSHVAGTFEVWDQKLFPKRIAFHPAFARAKLDQAVNSQVSLNPKVLKEAARSRGGRGQDMHKKRADANEEGVKAVLRDAFAREPVPPPKQFFHYLMRYGVALLGIDWREDEDAIRKPTQGTQETAQKYKDRLAKWEEKKDGWDPIHVLIPHPGRTLCPPYQAEPECVIIRGQRYAKELYDLTRDKGRYAAKVVNAYDPKDSPYTMVKTLEWFSAGYHGLILDGGELLFMEEPFYKFQPFTLSYSGWGVEVYDGTEQSRDPRYLAVGLLHGLFEELVTHAKLLSSLQNSVYRNAFARLVGPHSEEWAKALDTDDGVLEGNAKDVAFLQFPAIQEALFKAIEASERRLEQATFTGALSGEKISGVNTVGQQQLIEMAARDKFSAPLLEVERAFSVFATHANEMVDVRGVTLHVGGKTLSPENIDGEYDVHVRFPQTNLILQSDARQIGLSEVAAFVKSKRTYQESDMQLDNVTEEETRLLDEELDALPQVHQVIVETALRERDMGELADAMEAERKALEAQAAMAQGQPGSNGASQAPIPQQGGI